MFRLPGSHRLRQAFPDPSPTPHDFLLCTRLVDPVRATPTTPQLQPLPGITQLRFSLIRFRSPLLTESRLLSLPVGTEMFHFPTFPLPALYIQAGVTGSARRPAGFPHSEILGSKCAYPLPEAYRRLLSL